MDPLSFSAFPIHVALYENLCLCRDMKVCESVCVS